MNNSLEASKWSLLVPIIVALIGALASIATAFISAKVSVDKKTQTLNKIKVDTSSVQNTVNGTIDAADELSEKVSKLRGRILQIETAISSLQPPVAGVWTLSDRIGTTFAGSGLQSLEFDVQHASTIGFESPANLIAPRDGLYYVQLVLTLTSQSNGMGGFELRANGKPFAANWTKLREGTISIAGMVKLKRGWPITAAVNTSQGSLRVRTEDHLSYLTVQTAAM